jgi:hypothetical protein
LTEGQKLLDWLKGFAEKLDSARWWKVAIAVGLAILLGALAAEDRDFEVIGLGILACGFGEWFNHRMETEIRQGGTLTTFERVNRPLGLTLDAIGILLVAFGLYHLLKS